MDIRQSIKEEFGGTVRFARLVGATPQQVTNWLARKVPAEWCPTIESATSGRIRCEDLRPDIDWVVLRNSDCRDEAAHDERQPTAHEMQEAA